MFPLRTDIIPVSYTHLDVYKRQLFPSPSCIVLHLAPYFLLAAHLQQKLCLQNYIAPGKNAAGPISQLQLRRIQNFHLTVPCRCV